MFIKKQDIKVESFKSSGPGGQRKNKTETAIRITHLPTGIVATGTEFSYQYQNKKSAFKKLEQKIRQRYEKKKKRIPTKKSKATKQKILNYKKKHSEKKKFRKKFDFSKY